MTLLLIILGIIFLVGLIIAMCLFPRSLNLESEVWFNKYRAWDWFKFICLFLFLLVVTICVIIAVPPMGCVMALLMLIATIQFFKGIFKNNE